MTPPLSPLVLPLLVGLAGAPDPRDDGAAEEARRAVATAQNELAFELLEELADNGGDLAFSPVGVHLALLLAWAGAEGETALELERVLGFDAPPERARLDRARLLEAARSLGEGFDGKDGRPLLTVANGLWGQSGHPFRPDYLERTEAALGAALHAVDFRGDPASARTAINEWVAQATAGLVPELLLPADVTADTRLVLTNALRFRASWEDAFESSATRTEVFHTARGEEVRVPMMRRTGYYPILDAERFQLLELPYHPARRRDPGQRWSMLVLLPREGVSLAGLERGLSPAAIDLWCAESKVQRVSVSLPRFEVRNRVDLGPALERLGLDRALDPERADLGGIDGGAGQLFLDRVIQEAVVRVDEKGTDAAAATAAVLVTGSTAVPKPPIVFPRGPALPVPDPRPRHGAGALRRPRRRSELSLIDYGAGPARGVPGIGLPLLLS